MSAAAKRPSDTEDLSLCLTVSIALSRTLSGSTTLYNLHLISISKNHIFMSHALQAPWWVCHYSVMKPGQRSLQDSAKVCQKAFHIPWNSQKTNSLADRRRRKELGRMRARISGIWEGISNRLKKRGKCVMAPGEVNGILMQGKIYQK